MPSKKQSSINTQQSQNSNNNTAAQGIASPVQQSIPTTMHSECFIYYLY